MKLEWEAAAELVGEADRILVVTHIDPDGDAIGSMMGLTHALRGVGKTVIPAVDGGVPDDLRFLPGTEGVLPALDAPDVDLVIVTDCSDVPRTGQSGQVALSLGVPVINLDHHVTNLQFGQINLVDAATVAASEGVLDWMDAVGIAITDDSAFCLLTGLVTDTLCFRTDNVKADTLGKAQRLMQQGAPLSEIVQRTVNRRTAAGMRLWQVAMPGIHLEDHVIWTVITRDLYAQADYPGHDDAGLVGTLIQVDGAYISAVFKEKENGAIEMGFRAVPGFDTSQIALSLGGGGHKLASGATVAEPLETLVPRVIALLKAEALSKLPVIA
ncbi:MAG TPA: bifunctional oligoribonuclease/PAP phosphatase NrnA [Aggregatilinea sp.]|uniref:DHH family phosphoesterase n=1 Tax=Aggregatilinea sp. TaxID=2806333 RepID=UPI002BE67377|nr:bifunctional oligoribonuclease/PAP phosphatase NrnA [Aggregatilinea sp.]HML22838.1 bifunctional oligoribonuclease/PAP phosphatase NrnA [Aggregatilinea sp.]